MNRSWLAFPAVVLASSLMVPMYGQELARELPSPVPSVHVEILTDTDGVNLSPYLRHMIADVKSHWLPLVAGSDGAEPVETAIEVTLAPDGQVAAMRVERATKNDALDKAAWKALLATHFAALPAGLKGPDLKVRILFAAK